MLDDEPLTEMLGPKCPSCGWRRRTHRPASTYFDACEQATAAGQDSH